MRKITGTQMVIGGILLYLLLRKKAGNTASAPVKPAPKLPVQSYTAAPKQAAQPAVGRWEIDCYHQVI